MYLRFAMEVRMIMPGSIHEVVYLEGRQNRLIVQDTILEQNMTGRL